MSIDANRAKKTRSKTKYRKISALIGLSLAVAALTACSPARNGSAGVDGGTTGPASKNEAAAKERDLLLRTAAVKLEDLDEGWEAVWDPAVDGAEEINPKIITALDELGRCVGRGAPVFLTSAEPTAIGSSLVGFLTGGEVPVQTQIDSEIYLSADSAAKLKAISDHADCVTTYVKHRIEASVVNGELKVSEAKAVPLNAQLPRGVTGVRFVLSVTDGSTEMPISSTWLAAGRGDLAVIYDIATMGGVPDDGDIARLAELLVTKTDKVADAL